MDAPAKSPLFPNAAASTRFLILEWLPRYGSRDEWVGETGRTIATAATKEWAFRLLGRLSVTDDAWDDDKHYSVWDRADRREVFKPVADFHLSAEIPF
jgi:hypothetical protein